MAGKKVGKKRSSSRSSFSKLLPNRSRLIIIGLICSNAFTVFTLYSNIPGLTAPSSQPIEKAQMPQLIVGDRAVAKPSNRPQALHGFVFYSAYRVSDSAFVALGLSALALHNVLKGETCSWLLPNGSVVTGTVTKHYPGDTHKKAYEVALFKCQLQAQVSSVDGGQLLLSVDKGDMSVYSEKAGSRVPGQPKAPFAHRLAYCGSPIYGHIQNERLLEWIEYHRVTHGVDFFHLYDAGGVDETLRLRLKPYMSAKIMDVRDVREINEYETWLYAQLLVINDCALRTRFTAHWAMFMDVDEFLYVSGVPHSVQRLLRQHEGRPWVTFGSMFFWTDKCTHSANVSAGLPQPWEVERLVFRQADAHCKNLAKYDNRSVCLEFDGHRKYCVDPRLVAVCGIHKVVDPAVGGVHTAVEVVHINHFRGINTRHVATCTQFIHDTDWIPLTWARDFTLAKAAHAVRLRLA